ncbi:unnamed protein product [Symbiodinium sp. CCMP2456]|nr:unnamed protein product [Symbiodinium sp. CCMP2456]
MSEDDTVIGDDDLLVYSACCCCFSGVVSSGSCCGCASEDACLCCSCQFCCKTGRTCLPCCCCDMNCCASPTCYKSRRQCCCFVTAFAIPCDKKVPCLCNLACLNRYPQVGCCMTLVDARQAPESYCFAAMRAILIGFFEAGALTSLFACYLRHKLHQYTDTDTSFVGILLDRVGGQSWQQIVFWKIMNFLFDASKYPDEMEQGLDRMFAFGWQTSLVALALFIVSWFCCGPQNSGYHEMPATQEEDVQREVSNQSNGVRGRDPRNVERVITVVDEDSWRSDSEDGSGSHSWRGQCCGQAAREECEEATAEDSGSEQDSGNEGRSVLTPFLLCLLIFIGIATTAAATTMATRKEHPTSATRTMTTSTGTTRTMTTSTGTTRTMTTTTIPPKDYTCVHDGMCRVRHPYSCDDPMFQPCWEDNFDFDVPSYIRDLHSCKRECDRTLTCTGVSFGKDSTCVLWSNGACDVERDNGMVWDHSSEATTCTVQQARSSNKGSHGNFLGSRA